MEFVELPNKWAELFMPQKEVIEGLKCQITLQISLKCTIQIYTLLLVNIDRIPLLQKLTQLPKRMTAGNHGMGNCSILSPPLTRRPGESVLEALPLFIKRQFKRDSKSFCGSNLISYAKKGKYSHSKRPFSSEENIC